MIKPRDFIPSTQVSVDLETRHHSDAIWRTAAAALQRQEKRSQDGKLVLLLQFHGLLK